MLKSKLTGKIAPAEQEQQQENLDFRVAELLREDTSLELNSYYREWGVSDPVKKFDAMKSKEGESDQRLKKVLQKYVDDQSEISVFNSPVATTIANNIDPKIFKLQGADGVHL
jgi:hypothetical protein